MDNNYKMSALKKYLDNNKIIKKGDTLILNAAHNAEYVGSKTFYVEEFPDGVISTGEWLIIRSKPNFLNTKFKHFLMTSPFIKNNMAYPGPLFPNNLVELEELKGGSFFIFDSGILRKKEIKIKEVLLVELEISNSLTITDSIISLLESKNLYI